MVAHCSVAALEPAKRDFPVEGDPQHRAFDDVIFVLDATVVDGAGQPDPV